MASGTALTPLTPQSGRKRLFARDVAAHVWSAPLVPAALALTAGIVLDRAASIPVAASLLTSLGLLIAWGITSFGRERLLALCYLWGGVGALGAAYHHWYREGMRADDIGHFVSAEPVLARVRGILHSEPVIPKVPDRNPLRAFPALSSTRFVLKATALQLPGGWQTVSGLIQVTVGGQDWQNDDEEGAVRLDELHAADEVECFGRLSAPEKPGNPGEHDYASQLRDQRIHAVLVIRGKIGTVKLLQARWPVSPAGWLSAIGAWCRGVLDKALPQEQSAVARALLLGESSAMTGDDWEKYLRTGVIHVLAISGQHLVVLGGFAWLALRFFGVRRRPGALVVAGFLMGYAVLVGGRPPVMRSAWTVAALCGGLMLRRPILPANSFALAWILVTGWNPTDAFNSGCLLSFLAVAILLWGVGRWQTEETDPLEKLIEESRPWWLRCVRRLGRIILWSYLFNLAVWLAVSPLVAERFHVVSPIAILLGPPMVLLTAIALLSGFMLLISAAIFWPLTTPFALVTTWSLAGCDHLVTAGMCLPGAYGHVTDIPGWWLWTFYLGLFFDLTVEPLRRRWAWALLAATGWLAIGLLVGLIPRHANEFRCAFLAVGHGGCTVMETPDGRVLLYDAGAIAGPDVTRRQIAPYLWSRGITRIDELFLSHADLDHFNGVEALAERFGIGQVSCTPTFAQRDNEAVALTLEVFRRQRIPVRILKAGDRLAASSVDLQVLHPPAAGPEGKENARSLVLHLEHAGHTILLTGDLESPGLEMVLSLPARKVDVLMAPHHGSRFPNTPALAEWASPKVVVSCQAKPRFESADPYTPRGARYLRTWPHGAVSIRSNGERLVVDTFRSQQQWVFR